jgi:hypothetical protein
MRQQTPGRFPADVLTHDEYHELSGKLISGRHKAVRLGDFIATRLPVDATTNQLWRHAADVRNECSEAILWLVQNFA